MNEVEAMTKAGETVGKGLRAARLSALRAGQAGAVKTAELAALAEEKLSEHGVAPEQLQHVFAETKADLVQRDLVGASRRTRKRLAKQTKRARKDLGRQAKQVSSELRSALDQTPKRRRRWPWIVGLLVAGAGTAAYVVLSRRPREIRLEDVQEDKSGQVTIPEPSGREEHTRSNGRVTS